MLLIKVLRLIAKFKANAKQYWRKKYKVKIFISLALGFGTIATALGPYSENFIFSKLKNEVNKLDWYIAVGQTGLPVKKHFCLLDSFLSYEENEVLWKQPLLSIL